MKFSAVKAVVPHKVVFAWVLNKVNRNRINEFAAK
jgi:hypothetical protein